MDQRDLALWLWTLLFKGKKGEVDNVGSDKGISTGDLAHLVSDLLAPAKPVRVLVQTNLEEICNEYIPDISKIKKEMGLDVTLSLAEAIKRTGENKLVDMK